MDRRRAGALLALAACIACSAAAPTASDHTALDLYDGSPEGCYYNFQHYREGDRIMTNEPCLNCTCHNRMLMCYLRVCPFTKAIGQDCTIEKRADQCCPIVTCPDVPVDLLTSTSTTSPAEYGATGLGKLDKYGCSINGKYLPEGSKVPPTPNKPCEHCYCIRNMTTCVMQECTLHVDGCTPIYHKDVCCPVRYSCDHQDDEMLLLDDMSTTVRPTPGFLLTTTTETPVTQITQDCVHDDHVFADGALIKTEKACEHCYCMKGDIVCVVQECGTPMENEGKNCTSLPPREGQCCPDTYICEGDELTTNLPTDLTTESILDTPTTMLPPRRSSVEGSGYRNEPDEVPTTKTPAIQSEHEGSGDDQTIMPLETTEKLGSEKPVDTDKFTTATEGSLDILQTTIQPSFGEPVDSQEMTRDEYSSGITEPQNYAPTTISIPVERDDEGTEIQKEVTTKLNYESDEFVTTTLATERYDSITTQPEEAFNTVPDSIYEEEEYKPHKHIPSKTHAPSLEELTTSSVIEKDVSDITSEKADRNVVTVPSSTAYTDETTQSTKEHDTTLIESATEKDSYEHDQYRPSTSSDSEIGENNTYPDVEKDKGGTELATNAPSTVNIPTVKEEEEGTTELDHDKNTVVVVEDDIIHHNIHSTTVKTTLTDAEATTLYNLELGSGAEEVTEEGYNPTLLPSVNESTEAGVDEQDKEITISEDKVNESSSEASILERTTISEYPSATESDETRRTESKPTILSEYSTLNSESTVTARGDHFTITTEASFRKEDESSVSTEKPKDLDATTLKNDFIDEEFIPTSSQDEKLSSGPSVPSIEQEFTTTVPDDISESTESTTEPILVSSVSSEIIPGKRPELPTKDVNEFLFGTPTTEKISEMTTSIAEYDAQYHVESGRIPGEGDCLLNGVTYRNNSVVPSTNNCHSGCKCASSIIKCDPIICSPPPDYMHNCQSVYDSPDACCPTYVCDHPRETVPPQSDNQMFGTESPLPSPAIECRGDQCEIGVDTEQSVSGDKADSNKCGSERCDDVPQKPDVSNYPHPEQCKDGKCDTPTKDCANGKCEELPSKDLICDSIHGCQAVPVKPCEGEHCKTTSTEVTAHLPQACENKEDCKNLQVTPCEGDSCKFEVPSAEAPQHKPCIEEDGCKPTQSTAQKCEGDSCKNIEIPSIDHKLPSKCEGSDCVTQTENISVEGIFDSTTESFTQKQTPTEIYTEQLQPNAKVPESTESQKDIVYVPEQQTNIYEQKESFTTSPDFTVSNELVTESESSEEPNELDTTVQEGKGTTVSENFAVDTEKSPTDTPATEIHNIEISRTQTTVLESQTPAYHKYTTQTIDQDKLPESHTTEPQYITTDISKDKIQPVVKDESLTSSEPQITNSEIVAHEQTTASYVTEPSIAPKPQDTTIISPQAQDFETQTTQSSAELELSTDGVLSLVTLHPKEEMYTPLTEKENEINTQKPEGPSITSADLDITTHQIDISSFEEQMATMKTDTEGSTIGAVEIVSKSTETTTEGQYGYTESPEYELPGTKPNKIGPVIIEPQEGTNTELPKPSLIEETTTEISDNSEYITETDEIATELPVRVSHIPELSTITPSSEQYITEKLHIVDEIQTKSPTEYSKQSEQFTTEAPVRFPEEETDTEINTIIKEDITEIPALFTAEPEKGLTDIEEVLSTGQDETTSKKSIPSESETTISSEQTDKSIGHYEPSTTERLHDIVEITLPNSEKPLYSDSQLTGVTKSQEADQKITEEDTTEKQEEITKAVLTEETSPISIKEEMGTEVPVTELGVPEKSTQPENSEGEENALTTSELPELATKSPIPENNEQEDETSGIEKLPEPHGTVMDLTTESSEPAKHVTSQEENNTDIPIMQEVQVNLDTIAPEVVTEQSTGTEIPQKELSKVPNLYVTDEYETEAHSTTTKNELQETGSSMTTTDAPISPDIMKEDTEGLTEPHDSNMEDQTVLNIQKQSTESYTETEEIRTEPPISHDKTNVESGFTQTAHTTESLDLATNGPDMYGSGQEKTETESPVQQLQTTESVEKITGETIETGVTKSEESITKYPEDIVSEKEPSGQVDYVTKTPELESSLIPNGTQETTQAVNGQDIKEIENTNVQDEKTTKAPEVPEVSELDVSRQAEEITKAPEQENKETSTKVSIPEVISQEEDITKSPEVIKESELPVTGYEEESTKATTDIQEPEAEVTSLGENVTGTPQSISQDDKTTETSVYLENLPVIIDHEEDANKVTMESLPEHTVQEEEVTSVPEVIIESLSENTALEDKVTKAPEVIKESLPEVVKHEEEIIATTEDMKVSLPEVSNQEKEVIKAPEETKEESLSDVTEQESEFSKDTTEKEGSLPELIGQEDQVTKSPEATTEFLLHLTEQDEGATKVSEEKKESLPEFTDKEEKVTKAPEGPKETLVDKQEENITKTPDVTKEFLPEYIEKDEKVTLTPEDKTELPPEIIEKEAEQTKSPEYIKDEVVTKPPEDTKEFMPELTTQDERVTKAPEETKVVLPEVTEQEMEVTNIPEDKKDSLPDILEQEVTKSSVDINEIPSETTQHGEHITKSPEVTKDTLSNITEQEPPVTQFPDEKIESPEDKLHEDTKESLPEITDLNDKVTKTPEESNELLPGITEQGEEVTKMPEDSRETLPEVTEKDEKITKTPEDNLEPLPEITSTQTPEVIKDTTPQVAKQEEGFTKSPEDKTESLPDITRPVDEVTKTPADTIESLPEGTKQDEGVTKSPEDSKESLTESTELEKEVTKIPDGMIESLTEDTRPKEDDKESLPEITEQLEETTKSPDDTNVSLSEITGQEEEVTKTPYDTKEPEPEVTREEEKITSVPEYTAEKESRPEVTSQGETVTKTPQDEKETTFEAVTEQQENTLITHGVHTATETIIPVYSESDNNLLEYSTPKQVEYTSTEQSKDQFSETTPDVIILEEHTHKIIETTPTARPLDEQLTTVAYDTEVSEEVSEVTSTKPSGEHIETVTMQPEITTGLTQTSLHSFDQVTEQDILPVSTEETLSVHKHDEVSKDKEPTLVSTLEETTAPVFVDSEKTTVTNTVLPIHTEKIPSSSEQSVHPEIPETQTVLVDELLTATTKATATKQEEDLVTSANIDTPMKPETTAVADDLLTTTAKVTTAKQDEELVKKPMKPEEQPIESSEVTPSTTIPESPKPIAEETHPTDELPTPEEDSNFPPSGISGYGEPDYVEEDQSFSPGTCRYGGKVYVSAQQIPRDDPCDFCFCFRSDIICLQQSCPPPIHGCHEEPIQGFCCPRYECPVSMATTVNVTTTTTTTTTTLPPHFPTHSYKGAAQRRGCQIKGHTYKVGEVVRSSSGPCLHCTCGGDGQMKCDPKACTPEPMLRQMIAAAVSAKRRR